MWAAVFDQNNEEIKGLQIACDKCETILALFTDAEEAKTFATEIEATHTHSVEEDQTCVAGFDCDEESPITLTNVNQHFDDMAKYARTNGWWISDDRQTTHCRKCSSN